jgi:fatty-acid desaturase
MSDESIVMSDENMDTMIIHTRLSRVASTDRRLALVVVLLPFLGTLAAIALALNGLPPTLTSIVLFAVLYSATMLGVECGYHRLFAHRSFKTTKVVEAILAIFGSMAFQGPLIWWAATHRRHHQYWIQRACPFASFVQR